MEHYVEIIAVISILLMLAAIIAIVLFSCTKSRREYKRIKNISEAEGTIIDIKFVGSLHDLESSYEYYVISYSFTDSCGKIYSKSFKNQRLDNFKEGDKITVYYDMDNPDKCVTDYKLKADKNKWWQALIITAIIIVVPLVISFALYT
ncbi:MAG: DUF3592 domain-containing protein [Ruminococcus sp.]|nr:DUF3592 domain-containing protein [Ruminococcus sp.]